MSKYGDVVALLDWALKQKQPKQPKNVRRKKIESLNIEDLDLAEVYLKLEARAEKIKKSKEAIEKLMKKEEKKPDPKDNMRNIALWLVASFPITGPLYYMWLTKMLGVH